MTSARPQSLSAIDALARGVANVRANAELVIVQLVAMLFIAASFLAPIVVFLKRIGVSPSILFADDPAKIQEALVGLDFDPTAIFGMMGTGLVVVLVGGTLLFLFYCWAQSGTLAVLSAGDAQAPNTRGAPVEVFRTFSWRGFFSWSFRFVWRFFWLSNLYLTVGLFLILLLVLPFAFLGDTLDSDKIAASCLLACGIAIPLIFALFVIWLAMQVSGAALVVEDSGVVRAFRRGLSLTGRRLGGLLLLVLLMIVASIAVAIVFLMLELGLGLALTEGSALRFGVTAGLEVLKFLLSTVIALIFSSAMIALVRGEMRADASSAKPSPTAA